MKADDQTEREVKAVLQRFASAYGERNTDELIGCFAPDGDVVLYGTGADEKRLGLNEIKAQAQRDWAQTEAVSMVFDWTSISAAGAVAWAAIDGAFNIRADGQDMNLPARITFILEKRDGQWLIVHTHCSTPSAGQEEGHSF